jgi:hypothetical protein
MRRGGAKETKDLNDLWQELDRIVIHWRSKGHSPRDLAVLLQKSDPSAFFSPFLSPSSSMYRYIAPLEDYILLSQSEAEPQPQFWEEEREERVEMTSEKQYNLLLNPPAESPHFQSIEMEGLSCAKTPEAPDKPKLPWEESSSRHQLLQQASESLRNTKRSNFLRCPY